MKNKFIDRYLSSLALIIIELTEIFFNYTKFNTTGGFFSGSRTLFIGLGFLVFSIVSQVKYNINKKQMEKELSKEYDERDELIDGKASNFTMRILMIIIVLMMFLSKFITIPTNNALSIIIIFCMIIDILAKKYYNHYF